MNAKQLLERGLRRGVPLWRIEDKLDWQENQGPRWTEDDPASGANLSAKSGGGRVR